MPIRLFVALPLTPGAELPLPPEAARHAQVRRVQPGDGLVLFNGDGHDWTAQVLAMGRSSVQVRIGTPQPVATELPVHVTLALAMPANDRMDALVEKATELGVAAIQPLVSERSVLRLAGERAERKREHWQGIAQAACEQSGRACVPVVHPVQPLPTWLAQLDPAAPARRWMLSLQPTARPPGALAAALQGAPTHVVTLSGPEGGLSNSEEDAAARCGFEPVALGPRVLRADTAPLAVLAWVSLHPWPG